MQKSVQENSRFRFLIPDNKSLFDLKPAFYIVYDMLEDCDCFEEFGKCANKCIFCNDAAWQADGSMPGFIHKSGRKQGRIMLCCGEPTAIAGIGKKIKRLKTKYDVVSLTTNGRVLRNMLFAGSLFQSGLDEVFFSLHGSTPEIHDGITQVKGSFQEAIKGIENTIILKERGAYNFKIAVNYVLTKNNISCLYEFILLLKQFRIDTVNFTALVPLGAGKDTFGELMPSLTDIAWEFGKLKQKCGQNGKLADLRVFLSCFPFCVIKEPRDFIFLFTKRTNEYRKQVDKDSEYICGKCALNKYCQGIFKAYSGIYGLNEFGAIPQKWISR